jgi:Alginate lyase
MPCAGANRPTLRTRSRIAIATLALAVAAVAPAGAMAAMRPGVWVTSAELQRLPERGPAWRQLVELSHERLGRADLSDQDSDHDVRVLATAMVAARTDDDRLRDRAAAGIMEAVGTERGGRTLGLARGLISYVVAADLIDLRHHDAGKDRVFRAWLRRVRRERLEPDDYPTLILTHELRPNNWGTHAGASRIAADIYLGDRKDLARAAAVFKGWLGDRTVYDGFVYGGRSWQADPEAPVGVNPPDTTHDGVAVGGALPDDMRRGCPPRDPPCPTGYPWEAMQGAVAQAEMLYRQGYDAWRWGDDGLRRAAGYLVALGQRTGEEDWHAAEDDGWIPWLLNARYGTRFPTRMPALPGKGMGFTDWTAPIQRDARPRGAALPVAPVKAPTRPASRAERATGSVLAILVVGVGALALGLLVVVLRGRTAGTSRGTARRS